MIPWPSSYRDGGSPGAVIHTNDGSGVAAELPLQDYRMTAFKIGGNRDYIYLAATIRALDSGLTVVRAITC